MNKVEKSLKSFLKLIEADMNQDPATAGDAGTAAGATQPSGAVATIPGVPAARAPTLYEPGPIQNPQTDIKFLSTLTMFTSTNPPESDTWSRDNNPQYMPLKDGRLVKTLSKMFPDFKARGGTAARYADNQFRVILRGILRAPTKIGIISTNIERREEKPEKSVPLRSERYYPGRFLKEQRKGPIKGTVETYLADIKINNKTGVLPLKGEEGLLQTFESDKEKRITLSGIDLSTLMQWTGITPPEEEVEVPTTKEPESKPKEEKPEKKQSGFGAKGAEEKPKEKEKEKEPEEKEKTNDDEIFDVVWNTALTHQIAPGKKEWTEKDKVAAKKWAKKQIDLWKPEDEKEASVLGMTGTLTPAQKKTLKGKYKKPVKMESKDEDFRNYFRMLLEAQNSEDLEAGGGGEILSEINETIFKDWFSGQDGIAAPTDNRIFVGNIYEWFAASSAMFKPQKRTVDRVRKNRSINITLEGELLMEAEIWIDARLIGGGGLGDQWTFYMLSGGIGKQIGSESYKTPGSLFRGARSKMGPKPNLQQQASVKPQP
jgi:hypothetical protein